MATSPKSVHAGEIWLTYLHFSNRPDLGKVSPVLICNVLANGVCAIALKVTSKNPADGRRSVPISEWASIGLRKPSYVRIDQLFEVPTDSLLREEPLGVLNQAQFAAILQLLNDKGTEDPERKRFPS